MQFYVNQLGNFSTKLSLSFSKLKIFSSESPGRLYMKSGDKPKETEMTESTNTNTNTNTSGRLSTKLTLHVKGDVENGKKKYKVWITFHPNFSPLIDEGSGIMPVESPSEAIRAAKRQMASFPDKNEAIASVEFLGQTYETIALALEAMERRQLEWA